MKQSYESISQANYAWGDILASTLYELKVTNIFFSPGSRSTPLILGLERHSKINCIPVLDERTAAFLALGYSKRTRSPSAVICTSGSALTHWFPAITEASHSGTPIIFLSADRPPELQDCGAGQTINQINIFGHFVRFFEQICIPKISDLCIKSLRQSLLNAVQRSLGKNPGPVHLNFPIREPFLPKTKPKLPKIPDLLISLSCVKESDYADSIAAIQKKLYESNYPIVIAGQNSPSNPIRLWIQEQPVPVFCDSLSPLRETKFKIKILKYEHLLRDSRFTDNALPDLIIVLGPLPTSKTLRKWIDQTGAARVIIEPRGCNVDPLESPSISFDLPYKYLKLLKFRNISKKWGNLWYSHEKKIEKKLNVFFQNELNGFEAKAIYLLSKHMPRKSLLHVGNSMPIRDTEWFWQPSEKKRNLFGNRGVNGIDGTLGTAIGIAHTAEYPCFLITGELSFLHDSNALLFSENFRGSLTVILINNQGGGIFENLPISNQPEFEKCFATPQNCDFKMLCSAHQVEFYSFEDWEKFSDLIQSPVKFGIRVIEIKTDRKKDRKIRNKILQIKSTD